MAEVRLPGGAINDPVRVGDTVRRHGGPRREFVHRLLDHFAAQGWLGAPRVLGRDGQGREVLSYLDGHVPWESPRAAEVDSIDSLAGVARLTREFHDLTAGTALAGEDEVVCHNDLVPKNTVYRDAGGGLRPVAFIDWDIAAPGARIHDLAHVCWQYVDLGPAVTDPADAGLRLRVICDAYGLADRSRLVETILWWQDRCRRGIATQAAAGDPAMIRLRDQGAVESVRNAHAWTARHQTELNAALS